ncbi:MAG: PAS domain-containing hybrid sensor histidine kinase/response regulator [Hoeflea sp.]|uniref:hybrid sensor histidine kinase/response regulator n=1 Tax=Hoeflea sp. TaxID=1940281 RepID=UPI002730C15C|nr:PAS domain-containing hybrid sensor histidine kinase/response regulator [Hoeflea sp.]MDP2119339.1 PAS domain-containing hybrid sensor histidine kinase/response regulator [Hoeflea sp.]
MMPGWLVFGSALFYMMLLFAIATYGDRSVRQRRRRLAGRPIIYSLSLAIYCTSWTYFGGVGLAASRGLEFTAIYIGPILMFTLGMPILRRIVNLAKAEKLTSIADFMAARYGKSPLVAALVALIAVTGIIPYIALQLKAVSSSVAVLVDVEQLNRVTETFFLSDISFFVTLLLAAFAAIFGTRHTDATEHQDGLILAVAMESLVKLLAFTLVGLSVVFVMYDGPWDLVNAAVANADVMKALTYETPPQRWVLLIVLSAFAIILLPRQFHVTVVENRTPGELRLAGWLLPLYLIAINLFVLPVAIAGVLQFGAGGASDLFVLSLPMANAMPIIALITFIGGFSAATAMVIVASVAVAIMVSNDIVVPVVLRRRNRRGLSGDFSGLILTIRRTAIVGILLLGFAYYRHADINAGLASIGLLSFAAIAQLAPAFFGGLFWRQANARGAVAGLSGGIAIWAYMLMVPSLGGPDNSHIAAAILDFVIPGTDGFSGPGSDPLFNAVVLSLIANCLLYVIGSMSRRPKSIERIQAAMFIPESRRLTTSSRSWKTKVTVADLKQTISRYLGHERTERSFHSHELAIGRWINADDPADIGLLRFAEQLLGSAIGSASARLVLSLLFERADDMPGNTARLLDEASEALQYNRDLLQTALGQMNQGITVFDSTNRLTVWNKRFRSLLELPEQVGQVGFPLESIISMLAERGDIKAGEEQDVVDRFLVMDTAFSLTIGPEKRIIEIRSNPMPDSGIVTTYADITERVAADMALKQANETLEQRVSQRTAELMRVNRELEKAQLTAEEANIGKTRFLAAAGHDILQPLNAARLYSSTLVERLGNSPNQKLVQNIDSSLESVEAILGAVLDISRLDTGAMKPQLSSFPLNDLLQRVVTDFAPVAREKNLRFTVMPTSVHVRSDPNLLRRLVQNLVSNAIKYTREGRVLVGVRRRGDKVLIQVIDTGIGIPSTKFRTVFREFARLEEGARTASGLGLGLSIVDRIARVLKHSVDISSQAGKGTEFRVELPLETNVKRIQAQPRRTAASQAIANLKGLRVLCVDNEPKILEGMTLLLSGWGCTVLAAGSLIDSLRIAETEDAPDVIFADYHLDDGTGLETIVALRSLWKMDIPALLVTADRTPEVRAAAESERITVQNKPIKPAALRAFLNQVTVTRRTAAE